MNESKAEAPRAKAADYIVTRKPLDYCVLRCQTPGAPTAHLSCGPNTKLSWPRLRGNMKVAGDSTMKLPVHDAPSKCQ